jgi:shikimate dehydrogenase
VSGFLAALDADAPGWDHKFKKAAVIGAGGAARAIVQALVLRNAQEIIILNRTLSRAEELVALFGSVAIDRDPLNPGDLGDVDLVVNTSSLGMAGQPPLKFDLASLPSSALVVDIVYVPLETSLLQQAQKRGLRTVSGLSMLLHQAVFGFERWFGKQPQVSKALRELVEADVRAKS